MRWENIKFDSFEDFYSNRKIIRYYYKSLDLDEKWAYKRFIYSDELQEKEIDKDCIWNFLNENEFSNKELKGRFAYRKNLNMYKKAKFYEEILDLNI